MNPKIIIALCAVVVLYGGWRLSASRPRLVPGVVAADDPVQVDVPEGRGEHWPVAKEYTATVLAHYHIHARVLGVERYRFDTVSSIAPVDLALGWGRMSDWSNYRLLDISQGGRFYTYRWEGNGPPVPSDEISIHSSNNHIIPATDLVARMLNRVVKNDVVLMDGDLVEVTGAHGFMWRSSLTREDTGGGACELFRVTNLVIEPR